MTAGQPPGLDEWQSVPPSPCPCGHGDVVAEMDHERPLLKRAAGGEARAFGQLYDAHVDEVYRYLLAWSGQEASARELTERVFDGALTWLPSIAEGEGDLAAWLVTMARDSLIEHREAGLLAEGERIGAQAPDVFLAAARLDDAQREVVVLRLLLGHSVAHTAHLAGYSERVVTDLQFAACSGVWQVLTGAPVDPPPDGEERRRPDWFGHYLEGAHPDPGTDPGLSDLLAVADALRQAAPRQVPLPDDAFMVRLRARLLSGIGGEAEPRPGGGRIGRALALARFHVGRHPWVATTVAAGAIGLIFGLQVAGTVSHSACGNRPCLVSTTQATAAPGAGVGVPSVSTASGIGTTTTTILPTTSARPPTTAARTTAAPVTATSPPTTARQTTTTAPPPPKTNRKPTTTAPPSTTTGSSTTASPTTAH
jgi:RNA polymerase sigma-70 factor (ECF subfamily)